MIWLEIALNHQLLSATHWEREMMSLPLSLNIVEERKQEHIIYE